MEEVFPETLGCFGKRWVSGRKIRCIVMIENASELSPTPVKLKNLQIWYTASSSQIPTTEK